MMGFHKFLGFEACSARLKTQRGVGGGGGPPNLTPQCSDNGFQQDSEELKHALHSFKKKSGERSRPPPICKHNAHIMSFNKIHMLCSTLCTVTKKRGIGGGAVPPPFANTIQETERNLMRRSLTEAPPPSAARWLFKAR